MRQQYRIITSRFDVPPSVYAEPVFAGDTIADCDALARAHFETIAAKTENEWERMYIMRIDVPEQTTFLLGNANYAQT